MELQVKRVALWLCGIMLAIMAWAKFFPGALSRPVILPGSSDRSLPRIPGKVINVQENSQTYVGYYARPAKPAPGLPLAVMTHGNAESMPAMDFMGYPFYKKGYALLYIEYPGYGVAPGSASETSIYSAVESLVNKIRKEGGHTAKSTLVIGRSVGGGPAVEFLHRGEAAAGLLVSTFSSVNEMARRMVPDWLADMLIHDRFDNISKCSAVTAPVFLIHGDADGIVPVEMSRELDAGFANSAYLELKGAGHNDIYMHMNEEVWARLLKFFENHFEKPLNSGLD